MHLKYWNLFQRLELSLCPNLVWFQTSSLTVLCTCSAVQKKKKTQAEVESPGLMPFSIRGSTSCLGGERKWGVKEVMMICFHSKHEKSGSGLILCTAAGLHTMIHCKTLNYTQFKQTEMKWGQSSRSNQYLLDIRESAF